MPQLDPSSFASQLFWLVVSFGILWIGLQMMLPDLEVIFKKRRSYVSKNLKQARQLSKQTDEREDAQKAQLQAAEARSRESLKKTLAECRQEFDAFKAGVEEKARLEEAQALEKLMTRYAEEQKKLEAALPNLTAALVTKISKHGKARA